MTENITTAKTNCRPALAALISMAFTITATIANANDVQPASNLVAAKVLQDKGFSPDWIAGLAQDDGPRWYTGEELNYIGQPVGGLYAGQIYLGGDGRLWYWDIFNRRVIESAGSGDKYYNEPLRPDDHRGVSSGFLLEVDDKAMLLDARDFDDAQFRGEYPIARLKLADDDSPVAVELEAFSPFSPTDSDRSSLPATVMCYTLTNTSDRSVTLRAGGWLENAGNRKAVRAGALAPMTSPLADVAGVLLSARRDQGHSKVDARADIHVQDFEDGYGGWRAEGDAFGDSPLALAENAGYQDISGAQGRALVNTHNTRVASGTAEADRLTGSLTSPAFTIERNFLSFTVAGGSYAGKNVAGGEINGATAVQVLVDDKVIATVTGRNSNQHRVANVDVSDYQGKKAVVRIIDSRTGSWGHIQADDFTQTDSPREVSILAADTGTMALAILGQDGGVVKPSDVPASWVAALERNEDAIPTSAGVVRSEPITLEPGESIEIRFAIAWHFANGQLGSIFPGEITRRDQQRHYYSKFYKDAGEVIAYLADHNDALTETTRLWRDTWYDSTLPTWFLDRTFLSTNCLASTAALRMHDPGREDLDGRVYFWEGVYLGPGTCTHVTHYEQAFGRLFPDSARAQRTVTDYNAAWDDNLGYVRYRAEWGIGQHFGIPHAIDGHAGVILRTYREHTTSTDNRFLETVWPRVKRATQFMIDQDAGRGFFEQYVPEHARNTEADGVLEGSQYHTLDKYWNGVIPWTSGMYLASLRASAQMAQEVGDDAFADQCHRIAELGKANLAKRTFDDRFGYFVQHPEEGGEALVNTNIGCHIDQLLGDYWTHQAGLPPVFPQEQARSALNKIFEHNLYSKVGDYRKDALIKVHRYYADNDEPGTFICTFPHGGTRQAVPGEGNDWDGLVAGYFSENMTGFTYQAAAHMMAEGMVTESLALCRAIHDRYAEAPLRRNPFDEIEYGNHYTRAMSGYGVYVSASGFTYHGPDGHIGFAPKVNADDFRGAFTAAEGWGTYAQQLQRDHFSATITQRFGRLDLSVLSVTPPQNATVRSVKLNGEPIRYEVESGDNGVHHIALAEPNRLEPGDRLVAEAE